MLNEITACAKPRGDQGHFYNDAEGSPLATTRGHQGHFYNDAEGSSFATIRGDLGHIMLMVAHRALSEAIGAI